MLFAALAQDRKDSEYPINVLIDTFLVLSQVGAQVKVLHDSKQGENHTSLRYLADAHLDDIVRT